MPMNINKFETTSGGKMLANGADCNGTFVVRGKVDPFMLSFQATKMYPDHCVFVWGQASIQANKQDVQLSDIDVFQGDWGFESG